MTYTPLTHTSFTDERVEELLARGMLVGKNIFVADLSGKRKAAVQADVAASGATRPTYKSPEPEVMPTRPVPVYGGEIKPWSGDVIPEDLLKEYWNPTRKEIDTNPPFEWEPPEGPLEVWKLDWTGKNPPKPDASKLVPIKIYGPPASRLGTLVKRRAPAASASMSVETGKSGVSGGTADAAGSGSDQGQASAADAGEKAAASQLTEPPADGTGAAEIQAIAGETDAEGDEEPELAQRGSTGLNSTEGPAVAGERGAACSSSWK